MLHRLASLLFPPRCVLCRTFLEPDTTDFCHDCRLHAPVFEKSHVKLSFVAGWTAVWYYKDAVRESILRFKFYGRRSYAVAYGQALAMQLQKGQLTDFDILTWVPIAPLRRLRRGYDQVELLVAAVGAELGAHPVRTLKKIRNTPPQSRIRDSSRRRANVLGAYRAVDKEIIRGKRILLLDDVITTGATVSECARTLLAAGAKEVICAGIAATNHNTK